MMTSTDQNDPFLQVQSDVLNQLSTTRPLFTSYLRIRSLTSTTSGASINPELASARKDLEAALSTLAEDLSDLVESVKAIEQNPSRFNLNSNEVARRKRLVDEVGGEVEDMREELIRAVSHTTHASNPVNVNHAYAADDDEAEGGDAYGEFEQQQQLRMMEEQDEQLDGVFRTVGNLREQADEMGRELGEQAEMLEVVDGLTDRVGGKLQTGMDKVKWVMKHNEDRWSSCCIGVLIFVLILLLVLVLIV